MPKELGKLGSLIKKYQLERKVYQDAYKEALKKEKAEARKKHYSNIKKRAIEKAKSKYSTSKGQKVTSTGKKVKKKAKSLWDELDKWEVGKIK